MLWTLQSSSLRLLLVRCVVAFLFVRLFLFGVTGGLGFAEAPTKNPHLRDYQRGVFLYYQNKVLQAKQHFERARAALLKKTGGVIFSDASLDRLIRLDIEQFLGRIAWERKQYREACVQHSAVLTAIRRIASPQWLLWRKRTAEQWESLGFEAGVMDRLDASQHIVHEECPKIPSEVTFHLIPPHATLRFRGVDGRWKMLRGIRAHVRGRYVILHTQAKGYQDDIRTLPLRLGMPQQVSIQLRKVDEKDQKKDDKKDPERRADKTNSQGKKEQHITQRPKSPSQPIYRQWWFWTGIGVAVVAAAVTTSVAVALSQPSEQLRGKNDTPFRLWDR